MKNNLIIDLHSDYLESSLDNNIHINDKSLMFNLEDALYAAKTAKKAGYNVVGIYDKSEMEQEELKKLVDIYIHNYSELDL